MQSQMQRRVMDAQLMSWEERRKDMCGKSGTLVIGSRARG